MAEPKEKNDFQEEMQVIDLTDEAALKKFMEECRNVDAAETEQDAVEPPFLFDGQLSLFNKC